MNAAQIITDALIRAKIHDPNETVAGDVIAYNLSRLNDLLDFWSTKRLTILTRTETTHTLTTGDGDYSIGQSGTPDISVVRPVRIEQAFLRYSGYDTPLDCHTLTEEQYNLMPTKSITGIPSGLFYKPTVPNGMIYFDRLPDKAYEAHFFSHNPFTAFADLSTEYDFAPGYSAAIKANLVVLVANDYGAPVSQVMVNEATETFSAIKGVNVEVPQMRSCGSAPGVRRGGRNILTM